MSQFVPWMTPSGKMKVRRVVTNGRVQKAFKEQIGRPMGVCMQKAKGVSDVSERKEIVKSCAAQFKGKTLNL